MEAAARKPAFILAVDDDPDDCEMIEMAMEETELPTTLQLLSDGEALLQHLSDPSNPIPDMILLDINMPRVSGLEALEKIKQHPKLKSIPVVMLTTSKNQSDVQRSYELGCNSYISKPVLFETLVGLMNMLCAYWIETVERPEIQKAIDDHLT